MTMTGDLRTMPLADLLALAGSKKDDGVISVEWRLRRKEIRLAAGRVVSCTSGGVKERLGQRLIAGDRIREPVLISALAEQDEGGGRLGDILLRHGHVDGTELRSELDRQGHAALDDLFTWRDGSFRYRPAGRDEAPCRVIESTCSDVILSGCARAERVMKIRALQADSASRFRVEPARYPPGFPRDKLEAALVHLALQGMSAAEICLHRHEEDFVVQSVLARLVEEGLLQPICSPILDGTRPPARIIAEAESLVRDGSWERAWALLSSGLAEHGDQPGLCVAVMRLCTRAREKLTWAGGLDVVPVLAPALQEQGTTSLGGAERVVAMRADGARPLRAIVRGCPVDEDQAFAAFAGLFQRGLLQLSARRPRPEPVRATCAPAVAAAKPASRPQGWEPPPRSF